MHNFLKTKKKRKGIRPVAARSSKPGPTLGLIKQQPMHEPLLFLQV